MEQIPEWTKRAVGNRESADETASNKQGYRVCPCARHAPVHAHPSKVNSPKYVIRVTYLTGTVSWILSRPRGPETRGARTRGNEVTGPFSFHGPTIIYMAVKRDNTNRDIPVQRCFSTGGPFNCRFFINKRCYHVVRELMKLRWKNRHCCKDRGNDARLLNNTGSRFQSSIAGSRG